MEKKYCTAIVLAAGSGRRMGTKIHKQYLLLGGKPVLYYSMKAFQDSEIIDEIILVCGEGEEKYCREEIVEKFGISKAGKIICGGAERHNSVWNGLRETRNGYVFIHDGARPFLDGEIIERAYENVCVNTACVAGKPVKDTIKLVDKTGTVKETPERSGVWMIQTPQVFDTELIQKAYLMLEQQTISGGNISAKGKTIKQITDDAMVVECMLGCPVSVFEGSYENIKITTPEDLEIAEVFLKRKY